VPLILVDPDNRQAVLKPGILADIAPTILNLMGLDVPTEMTGKNLVA
jgi:2,3-bisphosphoglycerate-independent phosphoglycerate mutase